MPRGSQLARVLERVKRAKTEAKEIYRSVLSHKPELLTLSANMNNTRNTWKRSREALKKLAEECGARYVICSNKCFNKILDPKHPLSSFIYNVKNSKEESICAEKGMIVASLTDEKLLKISL